MDELIQAWQIVIQAAQNSAGSFAYHQNLQQAIGLVAGKLQEVIDKEEVLKQQLAENAENFD